MSRSTVRGFTRGERRHARAHARACEERVPSRVRGTRLLRARAESSNVDEPRTRDACVVKRRCVRCPSRVPWWWRGLWPLHHVPGYVPPATLGTPRTPVRGVLAGYSANRCASMARASVGLRFPRAAPATWPGRPRGRPVPSSSEPRQPVHGTGWRGPRRCLDSARV